MNRTLHAVFIVNLPSYICPRTMKSMCPDLRAVASEGRVLIGAKSNPLHNLERVKKSAQSWRNILTANKLLVFFIYIKYRVVPGKLIIYKKNYKNVQWKAKICILAFQIILCFKSFFLRNRSPPPFVLPLILRKLEYFVTAARYPIKKTTF